MEERFNKIWYYTEKCLICENIFHTSFPGNDIEYGYLPFITASAEIDVLTIDKLPPEWEEINNLLDVAGKNSNIKIDSDLKRGAWRYFLDKSENNNYFYLNSMKGCSYCGNTDQNMIEIIEEQHAVSKERKISYKTWNTLNGNEKIQKVQEYLENPIPATHPILKEVYP